MGEKAYIAQYILFAVAGTVTEEKHGVLRVSGTGNQPSLRVRVDCREERGF